MITQILGIIGDINPIGPFEQGQYYAGLTYAQGGGFIRFLNNIIRLLIIVGGLWTFLNIILAGFGFLGAGEDPKKISNAWNKIWQSALGLIFILGSFVLAGIFGYLLFRDPRAILNPKIYAP